MVGGGNVVDEFSFPDGTTSDTGIVGEIVVIKTRSHLKITVDDQVLGAQLCRKRRSGHTERQ